MLVEVFVIILTVCCLCFFLREKFQLGKVNSIFLLLLFYYAMCVPIDIAFGIEIHTNDRLHFIDFNKKESVKLIAYISFLYAAFLCSYILAFFNTRVATAKHRDFYESICPKYSSVLVWNIVLFVFYLFLFFGVTRTDKNLLIQSSLFFKLVSLSNVVAFCLNTYFIFYAKVKKEVVVVTLIAIFGVFLTGGRTTVVYFLFLYFIKFPPVLNVKAKILLGSVAMFFFVFFKGFYANVLNLLRGYPLEPLLSSTYVVGFSRFEGVMSYSILGTVINDYSFIPPYSLFESIKTLFLTTFFRGAFADFPETLAERYLVKLAPEVASEGGGIAFSGILNLWLDGGTWGVILGGAMLGYVVRKCDSARGSLWVPFLLMVVIRFFRSDFASMYKRFFIINGGMMLILISFLYIWFRINQHYRNSNGEQTLFH